MTDQAAFYQKLRSQKNVPTEFLAHLKNRFAQTEPNIRAFLPEDARFERLATEVEQLFEAYPNPNQRPPLFGIPFGVKDIFHVAGFPTRAGSPIPPERLAGPEAKTVSQLKKAGALFFGKTVTTEFAYFGPGPTRNPHNLAHTPGGSSSGSAAAVAAGVLPFAFGTQTIGSINRPASFCGCVGYKPTYNRIAAQGVIPVSQSVDTVGFFTPQVELAILFAAVLVDDWQTTAPNENLPVLGIPVGPYLQKPTAEMQAHFENCCQRLRSSGYVIKEIEMMPHFEMVSRQHNQIVAYEAAQNHTHWLAEFEPVLHPKTIDLIRRGQNTYQKDYQQALAGRAKLRAEFQAQMAAHQIDLWLSPPALGVAPKGLSSTGDPVMNLPWSYCGFPTVTLPAGQNADGLPLGLQITGDWMQDEALLNGCLKLAKCL